MLRRLSILMLVLCALGCINVNAQFTSAPAFPGAEGYGRYTTGGRGGTVYHVTTLEDYCDNTDYSPTKTKDSEIVGSLRYAVKKSGARIIVFDVSGTIELKAPLKIQNDDLTILGQTAPGDGICLKNYTVSIFANNVIIRYIRCRLGNDGRRYYNSGTALSGSDQIVEDDAMNAYQKTGSEKHNIIIDHCSISWSVDECGSFYGNQDFTMQWCMLTESLRNAGHTKGNHGYGGIWGGERASFHHNLLANHDSRNPRFDHGYVSTLAGPVDYTNNVLYNWGSNSAYGGENKPGETSKKFNMINNYYRYGGATSDKDRLLNPTTYCTNCSSSGTDVVPGTFYISGNYMYGSSTVTNDNTCSSAIQMDSKGKSYSDWKSGYVSTTKFKATTQDFSSYNTISLHTAENTYDKVLQYAGASLSRDAVDTRVCNDAKNGTTSYTTSTGKGTNGATGGFIDMPSDVGGYPTLTGTKATDTDGDGIPDEWEEAHGLNKNSAADALTYTLDTKHGYYTNLEVYANYLVQDITKAERAGATDSFDEYYPLDSDDPASTQTVITASPTSVDITGTASASVTLSSNSSGAYSITAQPNESVATASISGSTITITGVAAGSTSLTVTQAASTGYTSATKEISITVTAAQGGGDTPVAGTLTWNYTDEAPTGISSGQTTNTDNGLTYNGTVNDSDKNKLKGIKLNSTGYCYFTKGAVAGTLAITFGPRSGTNSASISVYSYASTPSAETLIGTTETTTALATKTIELSATQNNIYLTRGASTETVITKIVFTPSSTTPDTPGQTSTDSEVTALSIDMTSVSIPVGTAALVKAKVTATNNSKTGVNISAADGTIVKTYSTGAIIGVKPGTTTVTFTSAYGGLTKTCEVTVTAPGTTGYTKNGSWYIVDKGSKQGLINAIGQINLDSSSDNKYIFLPNGTYDLGAMGMTTILTKKVSIIGESEDGVIIKSKLTNGTDGTSYEGLGSATTLLNRGSDLYLQDITIQNAMNYYNGGGRAACLQDEGTSTVAKRVKLLSYQDTYYSHKDGAKFYWEDSEIHGTVDFMCGSSSVFYNRCLLYAESRESTAGKGQCTLTAPAGNSTDKGYCFYDCTIDANCASFDLGRAWKNGANSVYINTTFKSTKIVADWFTLKGMSDNVVAGTFSTYGSKKSDGTSFAPSSSSKTFSDKSGNNSVTKSIVMSASDATNYTLDKFFTDWQPDQVAAQKTMSTPSASGKTISWSAVSEAAGYLIEKDGEFVGITTTTSYTVDEDGTYTVRAANARGGFGEGVEVFVGNVPRTVFELDFEEASDNNYGFTVAAGSVATMTQVQRNDGTHMFHIYQGDNNDRTVNLTLGNESLTNYKLEFDLGITSGNSNASTLTFNGKNGVLFTVNFTGSAETATVKNADGTELGTISTTKYNNPNTISTSALPSALHHFIIEGSESGITLAVTGSIAETKISETYNQVTNISNLLGRYHTHIVYDNIILTTIDPLFSEDANYTTFTEGTYTVKLKKTFPAGKWTSLVLPFSATTAQLMAAFPNNAANTEVAVIKEMRNNMVYFTTQAKIDANVPVLIKVGDVSTDNTYTFTDVTVVNPTSAPNTEKKDGIMMKGMYKKTGYNDGQVYNDRQHLYFVAQSKFYDWSYLDYMPPFSAYIYTDAANNVAGAKPLIFMLDGEATGISNIDSDKKDDGLEYNAVGQRISKAAKGLHIKNGKKYFVK